MKKLFLLATLAAIISMQVTYNSPDAFGAATTYETVGAATLDTTDGAVTGTDDDLTAASGAGDSVNFAGDHTLTISGDGLTAVTGLAAITAATDGEGTVVVGLDNATDSFTIGSIGVDGTAAVGNLTINEGIVVVSGATNAIGAVTMNGGTIAINHNTALGTAAVTLGGNATLTKNDTTSAFTIGNGIEVGTNTLTIDNSDTVNGFALSGIISGTGSLVKTGDGALTLGGVNTYTGGTTISGGTLIAGVADAFANSASMDIKAGSVFDMGDTAQTINNLSGDADSSIVNSGTGAALTLNNNANTTFAGNIDDTNTTSVNKIGAGELTLTGNNAYLGTFSVAEGGLVINNDNVDTFGAIAGTVEVQQDAWIYGQGGTVGGLTLRNGSVFLADSAADGSYNGIKVNDANGFAVDAGAIVDMDGISRTSGGAFFGVGGSWATTDDMDRFNAALGATDYAFYGYQTNATGDLLVSDFTRRARISDIYVNSLLMHDNSTIRKAASDRITQNFLYWNDPCVKKCKPCGNSIWVDYVGRKNTLQSTYNRRDAEFESNGVQVGVDLFSNRCTQFGVMFGFEKEKDSLDVFRSNLRYTDRVEADDYYVGFYGARMLANSADIRGYVGYGHQSYDYTRFGRYNNVATRHFGSYDGDTFEASVELGRRFYVNQCLSFRPVIGFDMFTNSIDAMQEKGGTVDYNYNFGKASLTQMFARIGSDVQWTRGRLNLNGGAYYSYQFDGNGDTLRTQLSRENNGVTQSGWMRGADLGNSVITINAGANYYLNKAHTFTVFGNYYGDIYTDRDGDPITHWFTAGVSYRF